MKTRPLLHAALLLSLQPLAAQDIARITGTSRFADLKTGLTLAGVEIELPPDDVWKLEPLPADSPVRQVMASFSTGDQRPSPDGKTPRPMTAWRSSVAGLVQGKEAPVTLTFTSIPPGRTCQLVWDPAGGKPNESLMSQWASQRAVEWTALAMPPPGSIARRWVESAGPVYGGTSPNPPTSFFSTATNEDMGTFAVFGGRSAVTETLQMQDIEFTPSGRPVKPDRPDKPVPVSSLKGVAVKSHPFAEMAKDIQLPPLPLADLCPPDRFFAYFPQPKRLRTVMDQLAAASGRFSSASVDGIQDYRLWQKYLTKLGLDEKTVQAWIEAGRAECLAVILPDLFIRDSTDITFLIRMKDGDGPALFKLLPESKAVLTIPGNGGQCHVARRGNVLIASTSKAEAELSAKLADANGQGSLGASDELRCMRYKLPESAATVAWCFFSDPFIRRLTGPEVKIGQHRRLQARDRMEALTAAALLYQFDHGKPVPDKATLLKSGYAYAGIPRRSVRGDSSSDSKVEGKFKELTLAAGPVAASSTWGTLTNLKTLGEVPVTEVTPDEAEKYNSYVSRYSDYWRRYFDPIAIRLDEPAPGTWSLSTFILPLVDNTLYSGLKEHLDPVRPASVPQLQPEPMALMAYSLSPRAMQKLSAESAVPGTDLGLTGKVALAFPDADPVLQLGGLAGMQQLGGIFSSRGLDEIGGIGLLVAMLTRPLDLFIEIGDEQRVMSLLESSLTSQKTPWINIRQIQKEGESRRFYVLDFEGFAQVHFDATIEHGWLHISNHPWSHRLSVTGTAPADRGSAIVKVFPAAFQTGGPAALFQAQNQRRSAILSSCSELLPWMETLHLDSTAAAEGQFTSLGLTTPLPDNIRFTTARPLTIPAVLNESGEILTAASAKQDPGILAGVRSVILRTSFEESGLRAELEWSLTIP